MPCTHSNVLIVKYTSSQTHEGERKKEEQCSRQGGWQDTKFGNGIDNVGRRVEGIVCGDAIRRRFDEKLNKNIFEVRRQVGNGAPWKCMKKGATHKHHPAHITQNTIETQVNAHVLMFPPVNVRLLAVQMQYDMVESHTGGDVHQLQPKNSYVPSKNALACKDNSARKTSNGVWPRAFLYEDGALSKRGRVRAIRSAERLTNT